MNKISCFLLYFFVVGHFFGQQLFDFENAHWEIVKTNWDADEFNVSSQKVFQTTSKIGKIDTTGYTYYKLNTSLAFNLSGRDQNQFLIRQDSLTGKVFLKSFTDENEEFLLYDFRLKVGDTVHSILTNELKGALIVTETLNLGTEENPVKLIEARINGKGSLFKFQEGVGSLNGFLVNLSKDTMQGFVLKCFHVNNELFYSYGDDCRPVLEPESKKTRKIRGSK